MLYSKMGHTRLSDRLSKIVSLITLAMERFHSSPSFLYRIELWTGVERRMKREFNEIP